MKELLFLLFLFLIFLIYQFCGALWHPPALDPFFPFFLGGVFWRLNKIVLWGGAIFWGLVVDSFSFLAPGPSAISYPLALLVFLHLKLHLDMREFFPALLSLILSLFICELLRLYIIPHIFELPLPAVSFYYVGKIFVGTLLWGLLCWFLCQISTLRDIFEIPSSSSKS